VELLHERCAGLDIGKKDLKACVRTPNPSGKRSRHQRIRTFATTTNSLLELRDWLVAEKVTLVVLEATGDYWRGAFYLLEDSLNVILVNASHAKGLPGRKTDVSDAAWLCQMGECVVGDLGRDSSRSMRDRNCPRFFGSAAHGKTAYARHLSRALGVVTSVIDRCDIASVWSHSAVVGLVPARWCLSDLFDWNGLAGGSSRSAALWLEA
jgi:hypothetical protein